MKHQAIVGNIGHFDNEIDIAGLRDDAGIERINIKPQVDECVFPDGHSIILLSEGRLLNLGNATGHPSLRDVELVHEPDDRPDRAVHEERRVREEGLRPAEAPRREGRPAAPRRARREADDAAPTSRPPTSASRSTGRTSPTTTATSRPPSPDTPRAPRPARSSPTRLWRPRARPGSPGRTGRCRSCARSASASRPSGRSRASRSARACTSPRRPRTSSGRCAPGGARGRAVRGQPAVDAGRRRRRARRRTTGRGPRASAARTPTRTPQHVGALVGRRPRTSRSTTAPTSSRVMHAGWPDAVAALLGATEETTTGLVRLRAMPRRDACGARSLAVNEARPSARSTTATAPASRRSTASCARRTCCSPAAPSSCSATAGPAAASRCAPAARGASVIVCEVDPMRALEARMEGFEVMPALEAAERGDVFITVTGSPRRPAPRALRAHAGRRGAGQRRALRRRDRPRGDLLALAAGRVREVRPLVEQYEIDGPAAEPARPRPRREPRRGRGPSGRGHGHVVRRPGARRRGPVARAAPLGPGVHAVPAQIDREVARLKLASLGVGIDVLRPDQAAVPA